MHASKLYLHVHVGKEKKRHLLTKKMPEIVAVFYHRLDAGREGVKV